MLFSQRIKEFREEVISRVTAAHIALKKPSPYYISSYDQDVYWLLLESTLRQILKSPYAQTIVNTKRIHVDSMERETRSFFYSNEPLNVALDILELPNSAMTEEMQAEYFVLRDSLYDSSS